MRACVIDGHLGLTVCLLNVHKIRAEKYIYKLAILTKVLIFIYANLLNTDNLSFMKERSLGNLYILRTYKQHIV